MTQIMAEIAGLMNQEAGETAAQTNAMMYSANAGVVQANDQATDIRDAGNAEFNAAVDAMITGIVLSVAVICIGGYATAHSDDTASDTAAAPKAEEAPMPESEAPKPAEAAQKPTDAAPKPDSASENGHTENNPASNKAPSTLAKTGKGIMSLMKSPLGIQTVMGSLNNLVQLSTTMITAAGQRTAAADNAAAASAQGLESYYSTSTSDCLTNLNWIANNLSTLQQDEAGIGNDMSSMVSASRPG
jgi:hypothetical protein